MKMNPNSKFQMLEPVLEEKDNDISIKAGHLIPKVNHKKKEIPLLRHYMVDNSINKIIQHNLRWANGLEEKPKFKFAYVMLPNSCNQRCVGCFTGQDKGKLPSGLNGSFYSSETIDGIIGFLKEHGTEAIIYGGGGEFFTWKGAFDYINKVTDSGLGMMFFTNGTLLKKKGIENIASKDISLVISLRDTIESKHNKLVGINGFRKTLAAIDYAMQFGMHKENKLAVEVPITKDNENRILYDFIPAMRSLGIIPFPEEYIQIMTSEEEKKIGHNFSESRKFFEKAAEVDKKFGYYQISEFGQRMLAQPKCQRSLYSFAIYPSGDIMDCPSHSIKYGNFYETSLKNVIYSKKFKLELKKFQLCPCSVFYTKNDSQIPEKLPKCLEVFRCQK